MKKRKSSSKFLVKEQYFKDIIDKFQEISNTPELDMKYDIIYKFLLRLTTTHKRILALYFEYLLNSDKKVLFFQRFENTGQNKNVKVSLLELKMVLSLPSYKTDMFHKLEKFMLELPESIYIYCSALFSKINITGLSLAYIKTIFYETDLKNYNTDFEDLSILNFSILEDRIDRFKGKVEQFSLNKYPVVMSALDASQDDILYYFKSNKGIVTNLDNNLDFNFLDKLDKVFDSIYVVGVYIYNEFNLIYLSEKPLHIIQGNIRGLHLNDFTFNKRDLDKLRLCTSFKHLELNVCRNIQQVMSFCYKYPTKVLFIRANTLEVYHPIKYVRRVVYKDISESGILTFLDYNTKNLKELSYQDIIEPENDLNNVEYSQLVKDKTYFILRRNYGKVYLFESDNISKSKCGSRKKTKILGEKYEIFYE